MKTIIYEYIDKNDRSHIMTGVGSEKAFEYQIHNNAIQILRVIEKNYSTREYTSLITMQQEELLYTLGKIKRDNKLNMFYPN